MSGIESLTSLPQSWISGAISRRIPSGFPIKFGDMRLVGTFGPIQRNSGGPVTFANCTIVPHRTPFGGEIVFSPTIRYANYTYRALPDNLRSPTAWPARTYEFLIHGDTDAVMAYQGEFSARAGYVFELLFYGADSLFDQTYSQFYSKKCRAELVNVEGIQEYTMMPAQPTNDPTVFHKTHCIIQATWQQLSEFTVNS